MPGKLCPIPDSRAYCEGRAAAIAGTLVGANPHPANSPSAVSWAAGHGSDAEDPTGWALGRDCCADLPGQGYTPPLVTIDRDRNRDQA